MSTPTPTQIATTAIHHVLTQIRDRPEVGYYLGLFTESYAQLTNAYAALTGQDAADVLAQFEPRNPKDPTEDMEGDHICPTCQAREEYEPEISERAFRDATLPHLPVLEAWESLPEYDRREILTNLAACAY